MTNMTDREMLHKKERHGMNKTPEHRAWVGMKQRCTNQKKRDYRWYGAMGVKVCDEWMHSFLAFYKHIGPRPSPNHTIDRIKVNGGYEPGNVRWATKQQQMENTRVVRMVTISEKTQSISAWEREKGLSRGQVRSREASGWNLEQAILTPSIKGQKVYKFVPQGYSRLKNGTFRIKLNGKYIKTVQTEAAAMEYVSAEIGKAML
jgi:hypothetical protein